ncbi:ZPR1 zinc finger domain-containing protein [Candidatus Woesearchaeota archaeon]|nr:ZPR1 zinc finger domain-containing protein [Candidatus Woesearchaeota archaeon]
MAGKNISGADVLSGETCPVCKNKSLSLVEREESVPYFGRVALFSMSCDSCKFHKSDVESLERREPVKVSIEVSGESDMSIRVVKSSNAKVRMPYIADIEPGEAADGYVTNVEGLLKRVRQQVEAVRDTEEDDANVKKAKNILKKLNRVMWGDEKARIVIEDPSGNSAILSDKAVSEKLNVT